MGQNLKIGRKLLIIPYEFAKNVRKFKSEISIEYSKCLKIINEITLKIQKNYQQIIVNFEKIKNGTIT